MRETETEMLGHFLLAKESTRLGRVGLKVLLTFRGRIEHHLNFSPVFSLVCIKIIILSIKHHKGRQATVAT